MMDIATLIALRNRNRYGLTGAETARQLVTAVAIPNPMIATVVVDRQNRQMLEGRTVADAPRLPVGDHDGDGDIDLDDLAAFLEGPSDNASHIAKAHRHLDRAIKSNQRAHEAITTIVDKVGANLAASHELPAEIAALAKAQGVEIDAGTLAELSVDLAEAEKALHQALAEIGKTDGHIRRGAAAMAESGNHGGPEAE